MEPQPSGSGQPGPSRVHGRGQGRGFFRRGWRRGYAPYRNRGGAPRQKPTALPIPGTGRESPTLSDSLSTSVAPPADARPLESIELNESSEVYPGWQLYFPKEKPDPNSSTGRKVNAIKEHFESNAELYNLTAIKRQFWFSFTVQKLLQDQQFVRKWGTFQQDLTEQPENTLACAGVAMHKLVSFIPEVCLSPQSQYYPQNKVLQSIRPRIRGYTPVVGLHALKVNNYDRMVAVRGTVIRASAMEIICTWMAFRCSMCGAEQAVRQPDGILTNPTSCRAGCRARSNFTPLLSSPYTRTEAFQSMRLQESMMGGDLHDSGRVPRCVELELTADLVDSICPGDDVTVTGILKVRPQEEVQRKGQPNIYKMYIRAVAVLSNKNSMAGKKSDFSEKDMQAIRMINKEPSVFKLFVQSLCPAIYGHEMVKAGLILGLFGGSGSPVTPRERRCEIHVLMLGDPGIGKSQMLQACANISPRGIFVCGNSSSSAGLTVSVRHEKGCIGGGGSLEAGALVLADQGACCIDEFDKMSSNHQSLLEVMEQQMVSVAKAGVLCSLPARTSVLAAANPSGGHYDHTKTLLENLKLQPALLSRFDLVFILLDRPNRDVDKLMTAHIQALHAGTKKIPGHASSFVGSKDKGNVAFNNSQATEDNLDNTLEKRLKLEPGEEMDLLPQVLMQKYIAYAKKNMHPILTQEAAHEIKKFYLGLRMTQTNVNGLPVTTRQLEALIRLTQARARIDLASVATIKHARDVLDVMRYSLTDSLDAPGGDDYMPSSRRSGAGLSVASQVRKYLKILQRRSATLEKTVFNVDELKEIAAHGGFAEGFGSILDALNMQGFLLKKGQNMYKVLIE